VPVTLDGTSGITTPALQVGGVTTSLYPLVSGTAVASTSGTAINFTSIPSWVKRITVLFNGVSTSGTSNPLVQIGTGGSPTTSGYLGSSSFVASASTGSASYTAGFGLNSSAGTNVLSGAVVLTNVTGNTWLADGTVALHSASVITVGGTVGLSGTLDNVRITTVNGTDTFDAGSINILYE
jgi:hypothetical protein